MTARDPLPSSLLQARYGENAPRVPSADAAINPVLETLLSHRSVRAFTKQPLPPGTLEWLVAAAQSAASSSNLQTWSVVAVEDPARRARIAGLVGNQAQVAEAPLLLVWLSDLSRLQNLAKSQNVPIEGAGYLDTFLMGVIDAALAAQNAVVAAESLGLGGVYIGAIRNRPEEVAAELGLPPGTFAVFGLVIGHPDPERPTQVKPRLPQSAVLSHERFDGTSTHDDAARYDRTMNRFYAENKMTPSQWTAHSLARLRAPSDLKGRHRLREALDHQEIGLL
jgi:nitroreductase